MCLSHAVKKLANPLCRIKNLQNQVELNLITRNINETFHIHCIVFSKYKVTVSVENREPVHFESFSTLFSQLHITVTHNQSFIQIGL